MSAPLRTLHVFAGIGGSHLATDMLGMRSVGVSVEYDPESAAESADLYAGIGKQPTKNPPRRGKEETAERHAGRVEAWRKKWDRYKARLANAVNRAKWDGRIAQLQGEVTREHALWRQAVLLDNFDARLHGDVNTFHPADYDLVGKVDMVVGGSPCQNFSVAGVMHGVRTGLSGAKSSLFYQQVRIAVEAKASVIWWENVSGATSAQEQRDFAEVQRVIREEGYELTWTVMGAMHAGSPMHRQRVWLLAWKRDQSPSRLFARWLPGMPAANTTVGEIGTWAASAVQGAAASTPHYPSNPLWVFPAPRNAPRDEWEPLPIVENKAVLARIERTKAIGNAWCPQQAAMAWHFLVFQAVNGYVPPVGTSRPLIEVPEGLWEFLPESVGGDGVWRMVAPGRSPTDKWAWGTPTAAMWRGGGDLKGKAAAGRIKSGWLDTQLQNELGIRYGYLNPQWAEALMGFPPTMLEVPDPVRDDVAAASADEEAEDD